MGKYDDLGATLAPPEPKADKYADLGATPVAAPAATPAPNAYADLGATPAPSIEDLSKQDGFDPAAHAAHNPSDFEAAYTAHKARQNRSISQKALGFGKTLATGQTYVDAGKGVLNFLGGIGQVPISTAQAAYYQMTGDPRAATKHAEATIAAQHGEESVKHMEPLAMSIGAGPLVNLLRNHGKSQDAQDREEFQKKFEAAKNAMQLAQGNPLNTGAIAGLYRGIYGQEPTEGLGPEALASIGAPQVDPDVIAREAAISDPMNIALAAAPSFPGASKIGGRIVQGTGKAMQLPGKALSAVTSPVTNAVSALRAIGNPAGAAMSAAKKGGVKGLGAIGEALEAQGKEAATGIPSALTTEAATAAATGGRALGSNIQRKIGDTATNAASTAVGMAPVNAALSDSPEDFAKSEVGAAAFGGGLGAFHRNRAMIVEAVRPHLRSEGARALAEAGEGNDPLAARSAAYVMGLPEEARDRTLEAIGSLQGLPIASKNGTTRAKLYVLSGPDYAQQEAIATGGQPSPMGGGRGFFMGADGAAYVNGDFHAGLGPNELTHTIGHEFGGHAAINIMRAAGAKGGALYDGLIGAAKENLMPNGRPTAEFYKFVRGYNKAFDPTGQTHRLDFRNPDAIEEFISETAGQIMAGRGVGELAVPKNIHDRISDGIDRFMGGMLGVDTRKVGTPTKFGRTESGEMTKAVQDTLAQVVGMKLREGAEIPEAPKNTTARIAELQQIIATPRPDPSRPVTEMHEWLQAQRAARKELADLSGQEATPITPAPASTFQQTAQARIAARQVIPTIVQMFGGTREDAQAAIDAVQSESATPITDPGELFKAVSARANRIKTEAAEAAAKAQAEKAAIATAPIPTPTGDKATFKESSPAISETSPNGVSINSQSPSDLSKPDSTSPQINGGAQVPRQSSTSAITANSPPLEKVPDIIGTGSKANPNLLQGETLRTHGLGALDAPAQSSVLRVVLSAAENPQVLNAIISSIPVRVVDYLRSKQLTPEMALHDKAVLKELLSTNGNNPVALSVGERHRMLDEITRASAEVGLDLNIPLSTSGESAPAIGALKSSGVGGSRHETPLTGKQQVGNNENGPEGTPAPQPNPPLRESGGVGIEEPPATPATPPLAKPPVPAPPSREAIKTLVANAEAAAVAAENKPETKAAQTRIRDAKVNAILDAIGDDPNGIHRETQPDGTVTRVGNFDQENPYHQALAELAGGIDGPALDALTKMQDAKDQMRFIRYRSAISSAEGEGGEGTMDTGMANRRAEYALDPASERQEGTVQHKVIIPIRTIITKDGRPQAQFFTLDNLLHNAESVREFMKAHPEVGEFPYKDEGTLTRDAQVYADNHAHGWKGDGSAPIQGFPDSNLPKPDLNYQAEKIPKERFDALNLLMHSEDAGKLAARYKEVEEKREKVATAKTDKERQRLQGVLERTISRMKTSEEANALAELNNPWTDIHTGETNELRAKLKAAGFDTNDALKSPFETLDPQHILDVSESPIALQEGDIPTVRPTGFTAGAETMRPMQKLNPTAVRANFLPSEPTKPASAQTRQERDSDFVPIKSEPSIKSFYELMAEREAADKAKDDAVTKARMDGTEDYTPAIRLPDGRIVKSKKRTEGHGELAALFPEFKVERGFFNNKAGKFMSALEVARERMEGNPAKEAARERVAGRTQAMPIEQDLDAAEKINALGEKKIAPAALGLPYEDRALQDGPLQTLTKTVPVSSLKLGRDNLVKSRLLSALRLFRNEPFKTKGVSEIHVVPSREPGKYVVDSNGNHRTAILLLEHPDAEIDVKLTRPRKPLP